MQKSIRIRDAEINYFFLKFKAQTESVRLRVPNLFWSFEMPIFFALTIMGQI